jgi:beta propeller repeat protein
MSMIFLIAISTGALYILMGSLHTSSEYCIVSQPGDQRHPALHENMIVYQDNRNGNCDIYGYNLETDEEFPITTDLEDQLFPDIHENIVVWLDKRDQEYHIYAYDLLIGKEWKISDSSAWGDPAIHGDIIVWSGGNNRDQIHAYNVQTGEEFLICENDHHQSNPEIFENIVAWEERSALSNRVKVYDLVQNKEYIIRQPLQFMLSSEDQRNPVIFDQTVIWIVEYDGEIFGRNMIDSEDFVIATAQYRNCENAGFYDRLLEPALYEHMVVWTDCRNGNRDIYALDLSTFQEFQITSHASIQECPALYENLVIWEDNRQGTWDIFGYDLSTLPPSVPISSRTSLVNINLYSHIILSVLCTGVGLVTLKVLVDSFRFKEILETGSWLERTIRDFKRDNIFLYPLTLIAILYGVIGLLFFPGNKVVCSFLMVTFVFCTGFILWNVTYPFVRITQNEIHIYEQFPFKKTIRWDAVGNIEFDQEAMIMRMRTAQRTYRINLHHMDPIDRDDFITTVRYPPMEGIEFAYKPP